MALYKTSHSKNFPISPKTNRNSDDKQSKLAGFTQLYLFEQLRLHSLLSVVADKFCVCWFRRFQPPLTICAFIRSFVFFELRKPSLIARFLTSFSLSHCIIACACCFAPHSILRFGGWICCRLLSDTRSHEFAVVCVITCRLRASRIVGRPLCAMK